MKYNKGAIIGYSGFIGANIYDQCKEKFKDLDLFNTSNVHEITTSKYDLVFCSALPAVKWVANKEPNKDKKNTLCLIKYLKRLKTKIFVLISTIDVHFEHPYGENRLFLEKFVKKNFKNYYIIRLPGVFGNGLKKNIIYDLIHNKNLKNIFSNDFFQWYDLSLIGKDLIKLLKENKKGTIELYSEPIGNDEILKFFKKKNQLKRIREKPVIYRFKPIMGYFNSKKYILSRIKKFIKNYK